MRRFSFAPSQQFSFWSDTESICGGQFYLQRVSTVTFFNPAAPLDVTKANLPHWHQANATYFVTFRLVDSLPEEKLTQWLNDRAHWLKDHPGPLSDEETSEYYRLFPHKLHNWLDQGSGSCLLEIPECRKIVADALRHFNGERYRLGEFVVASNHVHVIVTLLSDNDLSDVIHSWKSFTAKQIIKVEMAANRLIDWWKLLHQRRVAAAKQRDPFHGDSLEFQLPVWQKEPFDHIVRSSESLSRFEEYIRGHAEWRDQRTDG
jgi:REP element-mobilizing transposase RayT